eukprot:gene2137-8019_t
MALVKVTAVDNQTLYWKLFFIKVILSLDPIDTEWSIIYVGSADTEQYDQELDSVLVGPVNVGKNKFHFQVDAPDSSKIPKQELCGVTAIILIGSYVNQQFVRVGYFVNVYYEDPVLDSEQPEEPQINKLFRHVMDHRPRITRFKIDWDKKEQPEQSVANPTISYES